MAHPSCLLLPPQSLRVGLYLAVLGPSFTHKPWLQVGWGLEPRLSRTLGTGFTPHTRLIRQEASTVSTVSEKTHGDP